MNQVTICYDPRDVNFGDFDPCFYSLRDEFVEKLKRTLKDQIAIYCSAHLQEFKTYTSIKLDDGILKVSAQLDSDSTLFSNLMWKSDEKMETTSLLELINTCFEDKLETQEGTESVIAALELIIKSLNDDFEKGSKQESKEVA